MVFPEPLSPIKAKLSPLAKSKVAPRTARTLPRGVAYSTQRSRTDRIGCWAPIAKPLREIGSGCVVCSAGISVLCPLYDLRKRGLNASSSERVTVTIASWTMVIATIGAMMYQKLL